MQLHFQSKIQSNAQLQFSQQKKLSSEQSTGKLYWVSRGYEQRISIYYYQNTFRVALICKAEETQKEEKQP